MNILILGGSGMIGHVIATLLKEANHQVYTISTTRKLDNNSTLLNIFDLNLFSNYLNTHSFDIVINCIGLLIEQCEQHKEAAIFLNSYLPHYLALHYKDTSVKIIHLSTDCVFSGKHAPYSETSTYDGSLFYDRTKALGEIINTKDLTFRMSIIGPDLNPNGIGLFNWFTKQQGEITGFTNVFWNGITSIALAKAIALAIQENISGLYHLVPEQNISKYHLLLLFKSIFNIDFLTILPTKSIPTDKTLINTRNDFSFHVLDYPQMLEEMKNWIASHTSLYPHYSHLFK